MADATFTAVDLSRIALPDAVELLDFDTLFAQAVAQMKEEMAAQGLTYEARAADPSTLALRVFTYFAQLMRQRINDAVRAVLVAYAVGTDLDNLAATFSVTRLTIKREGKPLPATILATVTGTEWTESGFRASWRKACIKAGISGVTFHDLRGTAVTRLAVAGATVPEIAAITGHSLKEVGTILDRALHAP